MSDDTYEHYRRQREQAAAKLVEILDAADAVVQHDYLRSWVVRSVDNGAVDHELNQYRHAEAMMEIHRKKPTLKDKKRPKKDHIWRKQQIRGRAARNKSR